MACSFSVRQAEQRDLATPVAGEVRSHLDPGEAEGSGGARQLGTLRARRQGGAPAVVWNGKNGRIQGCRPDQVVEAERGQAGCV